ncbi:MAG: hypothetical protein E7414_02260 [Ruminococcaceae bacterium]|nr:hypothetical protein [Oscillospiraceae bacterium]
MAITKEVNIDGEWGVFKKIDMPDRTIDCLKYCYYMKEADDMTQIYYNRFMIFVLPVIIGLLLGICLWKMKRTYILSGLMLLVGVAWYCILAHINTHGSEGPGLLALMYSLMSLAFIVIEIVKFAVRTLKARSF